MSDAITRGLESTQELRSPRRDDLPSSSSEMLLRIQAFAMALHLLELNCPPGLKNHFNNWTLRRSLCICHALYRGPMLRFFRGPWSTCTLFPSWKSTYRPGLERFMEVWYHRRPQKGIVPWIKTLARRVQPRLISGDKEKATSFTCQGWSGSWRGQLDKTTKTYIYLTQQICSGGCSQIADEEQNFPTANFCFCCSHRVATHQATSPVHAATPTMTNASEHRLGRHKRGFSSSRWGLGLREGGDELQGSFMERTRRSLRSTEINSFSISTPWIQTSQP